MASLYTHRTANIRRTFLLMGLFSMIVIGVAWGASYIFQNASILYFVVGIAIIMNVGSYWYSDTIVIKLTGAKPITRKSHFDYWTLVENLCISIGAPMPKLYIIEDPSPNAFATGRSPEHSAIAVTQGLLDMMDKTELEGVVAHELAHIQNRDTLLMTATVVLFGIVTILLDILLRDSLRSDSRAAPVIFIAALVAYIITPIVLTVIKYAISRKREFLADATAAIYTRYPEGLASALQKIEQAAKPMRNASTATAHLFISDPFAEKEKKPHKGIAFSMHRYFETHPSIPRRVAALMNDSQKV